MRLRFRLPMAVLAAALLGLIAVLATLQYRWLGRISEAERERMTTTLNTRAAAFAHDFDREVTRAYLMFQHDLLTEPENLAARVAARYERWQATARYPRLLKDLFVVPQDGAAPGRLQRFNPSTRFLEPAEWPESLTAIRTELMKPRETRQDSTHVMLRTLPTSLWEDGPALLVPTPHVIVHERDGANVRLMPRLSFVVLVFDRAYLVDEMFPALAQEHFKEAGDGFNYQLAVVSAAGRGVLYRSTPEYAPAAESKADATVDLFQVRTQEFGALASEVRRWTTFLARTDAPPGDRGGGRAEAEARVLLREAMRGPGGDSGRSNESAVSLFVQQGAPVPSDKITVIGSTAAAAKPPGSEPRWRLLVTHPAGSLEGYVGVARRRNLIVSSGILAVLGLSVAFLVVSTRRAQELARQQMEFVAAVSHELRTPLAVIRSAADNLAEGVVRDDDQIRKYGELVRGEGRRLTEMVEQILELSGIHSGQRGFALRAVSIGPLLDDIVTGSAALIDAAEIRVDVDLPTDLPPVLGDEPALRRVFQNLIGNAIKYGAAGKWIGLRARRFGSEVHITVADRGIGIEPAEQARVFEPFYRAAAVVAAQIQGAGLGLSLVHRIVEAHQGRITVESAPGAGSEFTVQLPIASGNRLTESEASTGAPEAHAPRYT